MRRVAVASVKARALPSNPQQLISDPALLWRILKDLQDRTGGPVVDKVDQAANASADATSAAAAANAAAEAANAAADTAQSAADQTASATNLNNSFVTGLTLTATDAGTNVTITVSNHTRVYGDGSSVSVTGGTLTGRAYGTSYWVFYDQPSRAGGTVTYQSTTTYATAFPTNAHPDRHFVGAVTTPGAGVGPKDGLPARPPNYTGPQP